MGLHTEQRVCETCFDVVLAWLNQATAAPEDPSVASSDSAGSMLDRAASTESVRSEGGSPADRGGQSGGGFFRRALSKVEKADSKLLQKGIQFGRSVSTELVTRGEKVVEAGKIALEGTVARHASQPCVARTRCARFMGRKNAQDSVPQGRRPEWVKCCTSRRCSRNRRDL